MLEKQDIYKNALESEKNHFPGAEATMHWLLLLEQFHFIG
jgi:hypothetical protein